MGGLEIRRIFLGLGLAVSAYLLILAWTSQSDQTKTQQSASISETLITEPSPTTQTIEFAKDSSTPSLASETDIPVLQRQDTTVFGGTEQG